MSNKKKRMKRIGPNGTYMQMQVRWFERRTPYYMRGPILKNPPCVIRDDCV